MAGEKIGEIAGNVKGVSKASRTYSDVDRFRKHFINEGENENAVLKLMNLLCRESASNS